MTKITNTIRSTVRAIIDASSIYDADTLRISRDGTVWAARDADKTFNAPEPAARCLIGHVDDMVDSAGTAKPGWGVAA